MIRGLLLLSLIGTASAAGGLVSIPVDAALLPTGILCAVLLVASAFFSSAETTLFALQPVDLEAMTGRGEKEIRRLLAEPRQTLASILIGNETVNIALSTVSAGLLLRLFPDKPWLNIVIVAPLLLVFGEVLPKTFAFRFAPRLAPHSATFLTLFSRLVGPIRFVLSRVADAALVLTGGSAAPRQAQLREAHLRAMIDQGREEGNILATEQEILHRVFEFGGLTVAELMTHKPEVFSVNLLTPWDTLLDKLRQAGHSRVPVWQGKPNNIVGILVVKRLLPLVAAQRRGTNRRSPSPRKIHKLLHPPHFVPSTKMADDLLAEFQARRSHMAIVVNEHGNAVGVVTLDDLLEELVGEIFDETDAENPAVTPLQPQKWTVRGDMTIADFAERFHVLIPPGDYSDLSGLLAALTGSPLKIGQHLHFNGIDFQIEAVEDGALTQVQVGLEQAYAADNLTEESSLPGEESP
jgi:putative hemolysin